MSTLQSLITGFTDESSVDELVKNINKTPHTLHSPALIKDGEWNVQGNTKKFVLKTKDVVKEELILPIVGEAGTGFLQPFAGWSGVRGLNGSLAFNSKFHQIKLRLDLLPPRSKATAQLWSNVITNLSEIEKAGAVQGYNVGPSGKLATPNGNLNLRHAVFAPITAAAQEEYDELDESLRVETWNKHDQPDERVKTALDELLSANTHVPVPMPVFIRTSTSLKQVHPNDVADKLPGSLVLVGVSLQMDVINFKKAVHYAANVECIVILRSRGYADTFIASPQKAKRNKMMTLLGVHSTPSVFANSLEGSSAANAQSDGLGAKDPKLTAAKANSASAPSTTSQTIDQPSDADTLDDHDSRSGSQDGDSGVEEGHSGDETNGESEEDGDVEESITDNGKRRKSLRSQGGPKTKKAKQAK